jgi:hypothetical protein
MNTPRKKTRATEQPNTIGPDQTLPAIIRGEEMRDEEREVAQ